MRRSVLHIAEILDWADAYHERTGRWPERRSGRVTGVLDEKWVNIDQALRQGLRGLPGGWSLAQLLAEHRGVRNRKQLPPFTTLQILAWADAYRARTGRWPTRGSGPIAEADGETWMAVEVALRKGQRGMPGGSSLARLLAARRHKRCLSLLPKLSIRQILIWADAHHARTGRWPTGTCGPILNTGETWHAIDRALRSGCRGLRGGSSLARLLKQHRGVNRHVRQPPLTIARILAWDDEHYNQTRRWPNENSGAIHAAPGETWRKVQNALRQGRRGLVGGSSLARLLAEYRGVRNVQGLPRLTERQILSWAKAYHRRHGRWPTRTSGPVAGSGGETWSGINVALNQGKRGLPGGSSLARLLSNRRRLSSDL